MACQESLASQVQEIFLLNKNVHRIGAGLRIQVKSMQILSTLGAGCNPVQVSSYEKSLKSGGPYEIGW